MSDRGLLNKDASLVWSHCLPPAWSHSFLPLLCSYSLISAQQILPLFCHRQRGRRRCVKSEVGPLSTTPPPAGSWFPGKEFKSQFKWEGKQVLFRLREGGQNRIPEDRMRVSPKLMAPTAPLVVHSCLSISEGRHLWKSQWTLWTREWVPLGQSVLWLYFMSFQNWVVSELSGAKFCLHLLVGVGRGQGGAPCYTNMVLSEVSWLWPPVSFHYNEFIMSFGIGLWSIFSSILDWPGFSQSLLLLTFVTTHPCHKLFPFGSLPAYDVMWAPTSSLPCEGFPQLLSVLPHSPPKALAPSHSEEETKL